MLLVLFSLKCLNDPEETVDAWSPNVR
jgi:hypothetical protein